jgi:hypothetical protein
MIITSRDGGSSVDILRAWCAIICIRENGWRSSISFGTLELPELPKHCGAVLWSLRTTVRALEDVRSS